MEIFKNIIANDEIKNTLGASIISSRFSHAYIIEGADGTGKKTIATTAAAAIMCESAHSRPCGVCPSCKKVFSGLHTDVRYFEVTKIDQIRTIKQGLYDSPNESDYKIYILEEAQKMNVKAQNALLISLEEPPKNVVFFLLTTDAGILLETIRSRAQTLRTELLDKDTILDYLKNKMHTGLSDERLAEIVMASAGSLGYAIDLTDAKRAEDLMASRKKAFDFLCAILRNDPESVCELYALSSMAREDLKSLIALSLTALEDIILLKRDKGAPIRFFTDIESAIALAQKYSMGKLNSCYEALTLATSDLNLNSNTALTLMSILVNYKKKGN